jgi:hypothetical protein
MNVQLLTIIKKFHVSNAHSKKNENAGKGIRKNLLSVAEKLYCQDRRKNTIGVHWCPFVVE